MRRSTSSFASRSDTVYLRAITIALLIPITARSQSTLLGALTGSVPAPLAEPTVGGLDLGLASLWMDPTASPRAVGALFGMASGSYSSVKAYQTVVAFRAGLRWSAAFGSTEIRDLFDTALTNQDPGLNSLRARAVWAGLDGTLSSGVLNTSAGIAFAGDENVADVHSSTVARLHLRVTPPSSGWLSFGLHWGSQVGGSLSAQPGGEGKIDVITSHRLGGTDLALALAASTGRLWAFSETRSSYGAVLRLDLESRFDLALGLGRYETTFGSSSAEWYRSIGASIRVASFRVSARYTSTRLGLGAGTAMGIAYEPKPSAPH